MTPDLSEHFPDEERNLDKPIETSQGDRKADVPGNALADREFFIRMTFEQDAAKGYELLFRTYYQPLCSHAARFVYNKEIAEDLVTEIFINFWKKELHNGITSTFRAYLFAAVRNRCLTYLRWEFHKIPKEEIGDDFHSDVLAPDGIMEIDELYMHVERVIHALPPQCQKVFVLSRFEGKSYQEIATKLGVTVKAVEWHISKALNVLRRSLKQN